MHHQKPTTIVLGGTVPHIALIQRLKARGYHTVLVDYLENPPAREHADEHLRESTLDKDTVLELARARGAALVISAAVDHSNATACYVGERLGTPIPYSYATALSVTNKPAMKELFIAAGIPTAPHIVVDNVAGAAGYRPKFPVVVKPADATGSAGVRKVYTQQELEHYLDEALAISRSGKAIVEEFKTGMEVSADYFICNGVPRLLAIRGKYVMHAGEGTVLQSPGSVTPVHVSNSARAHLNETAQRLAQAFDLDNTPLLVQALIDGDEVNVIEFAPRIGGGLAFRTIQLMTGFDIMGAAIDSFLGQTPEIGVTPTDKCYSTNIIYARPGILGEVVGMDELMSQSVVKEYYPYRFKGSTIAADMSTRSRVGAFILEGESEVALIERLKLALEKLEVFNTTGSPIMRKDIYASVLVGHGI